MAICLATCLVVGVIPRQAADETPSAKEVGRLRDTILVLDDQFWNAASRHDVETGAGSSPTIIMDSSLAQETRWLVRIVAWGCLRQRLSLS
jgi:hypothetical protein